MKRILAMVLACIMLLVVFLMAGCKDSTPKETTGNPSSTTTPEKPGETTGNSQSTPSDEGTTAPPPSDTTTDDVDDPPIVDGLSKLPGYEDVDFRGRTFVIAADDGSGDSWRSDYEIYSEDADTVSVAVRRRNDLMKALYNCNIKLIASPSPGGLATADVTGNQHTIDMYNAKYGYYNANGRYNLASFKIDFTNPWWDQTFSSTFGIKDASGNITMPYCVGDFALSAFRATHAIIYDRTVYENAGISDDIYELVKTKKWTMDKFVEMIKLAAKDENGNQTFAYADGDIMGWLRTGHATHGMHAASGLSIITNENGSLKLQMANNAGAWNDVIDKAISVWHTAGAETLGYSTVHEALKTQRTLFASEVIGTLEVVKDADVSLGLVPYPLYSENQENYAHYVDNHLAYYCVPTSVPDIDAVADFMELLAYHSKYIVRSAWIEQYCYEYLGDMESAEMLDIILDTRTYDPGYLLWTYEGEISHMIETRKNNVTKFAERNVASINKAIETHVSNLTNANR